MASTVTMGDLVTQVRQRADMENSQFVSSAELYGYINSAAQDLYDILTYKMEDYYTISASVVTDGVGDTFALPSNFYKLVGVDYSLAGMIQPMEKFNFQDRNNYRYNAQLLRYRIIKDSIVFKPTPSAQTITIWYVPAFTKMDEAEDTFDGINGWEDLVVVDAAIKCLMKEESDVSGLLAEKAQLMDRIEKVANNRDMGKPEVVNDVTRARMNYEFYYGDQ
jgi:hypothetical protein